MTALRTPDGRYVVVRGRLWRTTNPHLSSAEQQRLACALMDARRRVRSSDPEAKGRARRDVEAAKRALGERGPVWWGDAKYTPYRDWFRRHLMAAGSPATLDSVRT